MAGKKQLPLPRGSETVKHRVWAVWGEMGSAETLILTNRVEHMRAASPSCPFPSVFGSQKKKKRDGKKHSVSVLSTPLAPVSHRALILLDSSACLTEVQSDPLAMDLTIP